MNTPPSALRGIQARAVIDGWSACVHVSIDDRVSFRFGVDEATDLHMQLTKIVAEDLPALEAQIDKAYREVEG